MNTVLDQFPPICVHGSRIKSGMTIQSCKEPDMLRAQMARQSYAAVDTMTRTEQASPHRLIELLYDELLACLRQSEIALRNGDMPLKSSRLSKALSILHGLESSLDFASGGEVAQDRQSTRLNSSH